MPIKFLNPVANCVTPPNTYKLSVESGKPITIGLVTNKIVDCDVLMGFIGEALTALQPNISTKLWRTEKITFADEALIDQIAIESDAAICAIGHCGSCTAGTIKDGVALVERSVPSVCLITRLFWQQGEALARSLGWESMPRVELPYPVWGTGDESIRNIAADAAMSTLKKLETTNA